MREQQRSNLSKSSINFTKNKKSNRKLIAGGIVAGVFLILAISLIVYFAIHGSNKQEISETVDPGNGQVGGNQAGNDEIDQTKQKQSEENSKIKRSFGVGAKILKSTAVILIGGTGGPFLYNKISSKYKNTVEQRAKNDNKEKDNGSYAYVDSLEKVVTKTEEKKMVTMM